MSLKIYLSENHNWYAAIYFDGYGTLNVVLLGSLVRKHGEEAKFINLIYNILYFNPKIKKPNSY